ncbi:hypothetical protein [Pseudoclavibacter sp. VKM Ac-2888]|uniref:hypothetical protein n=1 Tax=Pseudoclavibacter sp. VKM Ac-2888 TaxID=2783830 RepID=UPI00188A7FC9|nr:hypothetical protein [Pseudoclavibacter sp. VKM Ac-2888]MBF4549695.1 hypothetical protein [Pseudoclavibacter sp. VKM Ac-2888]
MAFPEDIWGRIASEAHDRGITVPEAVEAGVRTLIGAGTAPPMVFVVSPDQMTHVRHMVANEFTTAEIAAWVKIPALAVEAIRKELG